MDYKKNHFISGQIAAVSVNNISCNMATKSTQLFKVYHQSSNKSRLLLSSWSKDGSPFTAYHQIRFASSLPLTNFTGYKISRLCSDRHYILKSTEHQPTHFVESRRGLYRYIVKIMANKKVGINYIFEHFAIFEAKPSMML